MKYYFAPMEGLTPWYFRKLHAEMFGGTDKYYAPFIAPNGDGATEKALRDILPEKNEGINLVPQLIVNSAGPFIAACRQCRELGYNEVNLNMGCPSGTVFAKGKGAGMLSDLSRLRTILDEIFEKADTAVSIKTRIGVNSHEEFPELLDVLSAYPVAELTVHPRTRTQFYNGKADPDAFKHAYETYEGKLCFNGDVNAPADIARLHNAFPELDAVMIGRGLVGNPALARELNGGARLTLSEFEEFHTALLEAMAEGVGSGKQVVLHMLCFWEYWRELFAEPDKPLKAIRKSKSVGEYTDCVNALVRNCDFLI